MRNWSILTRVGLVVGVFNQSLWLTGYYRHIYVILNSMPMGLLNTLSGGRQIRGPMPQDILT